MDSDVVVGTVPVEVVVVVESLETVAAVVDVGAACDIGGNPNPMLQDNWAHNATQLW
jgi:hypothetical protein